MKVFVWTGLLSVAVVAACSVVPTYAQPGQGPGGGGGGSGDPPRAVPGLAPAVLAAMAAGGYFGKRFFKKDTDKTP